MATGVFEAPPLLEEPTVNSRELKEFVSIRLASANVSRLLCVSQLNGAFDPKEKKKDLMGMPPENNPYQES